MTSDKMTLHCGCCPTKHGRGLMCPWHEREDQEIAWENEKRRQP